MSAIHASTAPAREPSTGRGRRLRPVPTPTGRQKSAFGFAIIAVASFAVIIVAQLALSVAIAQGAYEIDALELEKAQHSREMQTLQEDLERVESPQYLARNAEELGMVPNANPVYLRLSDGAVLGVPTAAAGEAIDSESLVPNALIDGDAGADAGAGAAADAGAGHADAGAAAGGGAGEDAGGGTDPAPPAVTDGLPTPSTH